MPDQLTDRARKAADECAKLLCPKGFATCKECIAARSRGETGIHCIKPYKFAAVIERHMQIYEGIKMADEPYDILARHAEDISKRYARCEALEQALSDAYAKLDEAKGILGKVL